MLAPMPTAARSTDDSRPAIRVSITPLAITAAWPISTGQARCSSSRGREREVVTCQV